MAEDQARSLRAEGRVLAIDPGRVRLGIAVSDPLGILAQALPPLPFIGREKTVSSIAALVSEKEIVEIVVGHPLNLDGTRGKMTDFAEGLAEELRTKTGLPVRLWDERLSSAEAERALIHGDVRREDRNKLRDGIAAALILQGFLDWRSRDSVS